MTPRLALSMLHVAALLFGLTGIFGKLVVAPAVVIVCGRALFALLALAPASVWAGQRPWQNVSRRSLAWLALGGVLLAGHWLTFFHAVQTGGVALATLGFASFPALVVLLEGVLFRERIRRDEMAVVAVVTFGLILVTPSFDAGSGLAGLAWGVLSGLLFALLSLSNRVIAARVAPLAVAWWQNCGVLLCVLPFAASGLPLLAVTDWLWLALLGVLCTGLAHGLFVASLTVLNARTAAAIFALEPVYGIAIAWWLFGETPTVRMLIGGGLIVAAIVLSAQRQAKRREAVAIAASLQ